MYKNNVNCNNKIRVLFGQKILRIIMIRIAIILRIMIITRIFSHKMALSLVDDDND